MKFTYFDRESMTFVQLSDWQWAAPGLWLVAAVDTQRETHRGKGHASRLLRKVLAEADEEGFSLCLVIAPTVVPRGLSYEQLHDWYERLGFHDLPWSERGMYRGRGCLEAGFQIVEENTLQNP